MTQILAGTFFLLVLPASFFGWGLSFRRLFGMPRGKAGTTIALGVAAVIFVGGWLNRLGIACSPAVVAVLAGGICLMFFLTRGPVFQDLVGEGRSFGAGGLILAAAFLVLLIFTQLPPWEYNLGDDLQKYFTWPTRMLATGTMVFSPTSSIGAESLGGQAFLHGITLSILPANYLAGLDGIFGLTLCLLLALSLSRHPIAQTLCVFAVVVIHPQVVNISTVYVGAALIIAAFETFGEGAEQRPAALGLLYAGLLACKPTFAIFVLFHIAAVALSKSAVRSAAKSMALIGIWCVFFISPWILLHGQHWLDGIGYKAPEVRSVCQDSTSKLFSNHPLLWGSSMSCYSSLVFGATFVAGTVVWITRKQQDHAFKSLLAAAIILPIGYLVNYYVFGPLLVGQALVVRYYTPMLIALVPVLIGFSLSRLPDHRFWLAAAATVFTTSLGLCSPSFGKRAGQMLSRHNQLGYESTDFAYFQRYHHLIFSGLTQERLRKAQNVIPAGAPVLALVATPFQLDFARNPIYDAEPAGIANPWAVLPKAHYLLWDKSGMAVRESYNSAKANQDQGRHERQTGARWLDYYRCVGRLTKAGRILYQQGTLCVYEIPEELEGQREF